MTILIGEANNVYYNVPATGGGGSVAIFDVYRDNVGDILNINVVTGGSDYNVGETLTIDGANVGGSSGTDDIRFTVGNVAGSTGCHNNFFGQCAGYYNTTGKYNNFFGRGAGRCNTTGGANNFLGFSAGRYNTTGCYNNFLGIGAGIGIRGRISYWSIASSTTLVGEANNTYSDISATGGDGSGAIFDVYRDGSGAVTVGLTLGTEQGHNYNVGNTLTIDGSDVGGSSGTDDIIITIAGVEGSTGSANNFLGLYAGRYNTTGSSNNFLGTGAGGYNTTGGSNNFFGSDAGRENTTGGSNNFFGANAGCSNTTGNNNNFFGLKAGKYNTTGNNNTFLGSYSGISTSASNKIILGSSGAYSYRFDSPDTTKDIQFAVGIRTDANPANYWLVGNENFNVGIGTTNPQTKLEINGVLGFGTFDNSGTRTNIRIGDNTTGASITSGYDNIFMGIGAGNSTTTGTNNNFLGNLAGRNNTEGQCNNFFGLNAGQGRIGRIASIGITTFTTLVGEASNTYSNVSGTGGSGSNATFYVLRDVNGDVTIVNITIEGYDYNVGNILTIDGTDVGGSSGTDDVTITINTVEGSTGNNNNFLGSSAGRENTTGGSNNFFGSDAGRNNTTGSANNFFGSDAGRNNTTGSANNFLGLYAGLCNTTGCNNNFLGTGAGGYNTAGNYNNFFGVGVGAFNTTGTHNTFLGSMSGISTSASRKIIIGSGESGNYFDSPDTTKDIQFAVGIRTDANDSKYWLVGDENFNVGIGTTNPTSKLTVQGGDVKVGVNTSHGVILTDANGVSWRLIVNTDGTLTTAPI